MSAKASLFARNAGEKSPAQRSVALAVGGEEGGANSRLQTFVMIGLFDGTQQPHQLAHACAWRRRGMQGGAIEVDEPTAERSFGAFDKQVCKMEVAV